MSDALRIFSGRNKEPIIKDLTAELDESLRRRERMKQESKSCNLCYKEINETDPGITISYIINGHKHSENIHLSCFKEVEYIDELIHKPNLKIIPFEL